MEINFIKELIQDRIDCMETIVKNIEDGTIKHKSKAAKEKDLLVQRGYINGCKAILADINYYTKGDENETDQISQYNRWKMYKRI